MCVCVCVCYVRRGVRLTRGRQSQRVTQVSRAQAQGPTPLPLVAVVWRESTLLRSKRCGESVYQHTYYRS